MKRWENLLFDLDGTLTDSAPGIFNSIRYALRVMGEPEPSLERLRLCVGPPLWESFERQFGLRGERNLESVDQFRVYYEKTGIFENRVYEGIPELLDALRKAGYRLAVASSKKEESVRRVLEHFDLMKYFDYAGGSDENVGRIEKSDVVRYTLDVLGEPDPSRAVMIGDREHDVLGARACGVEAIGVLWGYGGKEELLAAGAHEIAASPEDLARRLCGDVSD